VNPLDGPTRRDASEAGEGRVLFRDHASQ
jgi:hypothetical protein